MSLHDPADEPGRLIGSWRLLRAHPALDFAPEAGMEFRGHGELLYSFAVGERRQVVELRYQISGDILSTSNPATPHAMTVRFRIGAGDVLVFDFGGGAEACFVRDQ
ncbi:MAG TPA: hypothetical protein VGE02_14260 [Gemmatimonadales bacterium]